MYNIIFKRLIDFLISLLVLILTLPLFFILLILLAFANNGNPFFVQRRPGKDEKIFEIIKFKTMNDKKDSEGHFLDDEKRLTKIGAIVRKTSLDEIPQLINVLKGDMSLIGPRPLLPDYLPYYDDFQKQRHRIKPGITGWAQVNGRNAISWEEKFKYDVWYVNNISLWLDLKIIIKTIRKIFKISEVSAEKHVTMPRFDQKDKIKDK
ncbi:sugar transferase [Flavobacterium sp. DG2-3]|uniref:sugar transferase n=1 Tax=Flavobacterium sp. DG2-3 TaxID=3068317 RepID=UPI00273DB480|nr:sugar transferase [Flavobacterium sp. DG2-3]MDP5200700.1 sugar transferase [Flavobacterium sp. DG2-3]